MKIKDMDKAELELLSHCDLTALLLKENKKPMNTAVIFQKICDLLGYNEDDFANKVGDYYTSLTTDKRFILLDSAEWDLRDNHSIKIDIDDDEDEDDVDVSDEEDNINTETIDDDIEDNLDNEELDVDDVDDDIDEFSIVDEEEIDL